MIHFRNEMRSSGVNGRALVATAKRLLDAAGQSGASLSLTLVNDETIRNLNREHRGKDKPTDVLSFPLGDDDPSPERLLGDVVISVDTAKRQAEQYDAPLDREIQRLLIHGILHVLGHDHEEPGERAVMVAEERRLAAAISMPWPYDDEEA